MIVNDHICVNRNLLYYAETEMAKSIGQLFFFFKFRAILFIQPIVVMPLNGQEYKVSMVPRKEIFFLLNKNTIVLVNLVIYMYGPMWPVSSD